MSSSNNPAEGALERLGINLETLPDEGILTPGDSKGVRFRLSEPRGYAPQDVDAFLKDNFIPTLAWYSKALHQRDLDVHQLGSLLDKSEVDMQNLRAQLATAEFSAPVLDAIVQSKEDKEVENLMERLAAAELALAEAQTLADQYKNYSEQQDTYINTLEEQYAALQAGETSETVTPEEPTADAQPDENLYEAEADAPNAGYEETVEYAQPEQTSYMEPEVAQTQEQVHEEPAQEEPVYAQTVYEEPAYEEPAYVQPVYEETVYEEPAYIEPERVEPEYVEPAFIEPEMPAPSRDRAPAASPFPGLTSGRRSPAKAIPKNLPSGIRPEDLE